jgi:hypothetical protein
MPSSTSPNMGLFLPVPGVTTGPQWATELTANSSTVDTHDHTSGKGVQIPFAAIVVNADLSFAGFQITSLGAAVLTQLATTSTNLTNQSLTNVLGQPYWRDNAGVNKKIILTGDALSLPSGTAASGYLQFTAVAEPATPGAGLARVYVDSTSKNLAVKNDAGVVNHGVQTKAVVGGQFVTGIADDGTVATASAGAVNLTGDVTSVGAATTYNNTVPIAKGGSGQTTAGTAYDAFQANPPTLAAAATMNIGAQNSYIVYVSGATTVTAFDTAPAGVRRMLIFQNDNGAFAHNATSLILSTTTGITWAAGNSIEFLSLGSGNWRMISMPQGSGGLTGGYVLTQPSAGVLGFASTNIVNWGATSFRALQQLQTVDGSVSLPGFAFGSESSTGFYRIASGDTGYSANNSAQWHTNGNGLLHTGRHQQKQGASVASATTITLGNDGNVFPITGTTAITGITTTNWQAGSIVVLVTASAVNLGHLTSAGGVRTKTGAAVTTVAGNAYMLVYDGTTWDLL